MMTNPHNTPMTAADPSTGVMLWRRIADDLEHSIVRGDFPAGERLPAETEIAERFEVNRHTVRRALAELTERGLVRAERGSGTYVEATRLPYPIGSYTRFSEIVGHAGREAGGRLIGKTIEAADRNVARRLLLPASTEVIRLDVLRSADRIPLCIATIWLPAARLPDAGRVYKRTLSITRTLAHFGIREYSRRSTHVTAAAADVIDARRLKLVPGRPLLVIDSVDITPDGQPILASRARFAADRVELVVEG